MNAKQRRIIRRKAMRLFPIGCKVAVKLPGVSFATIGEIVSKPGASISGTVGAKISGSGMTNNPLHAWVFVKYANGRKYWRSLRHMTRV